MGSCRVLDEVMEQLTDILSENCCMRPVARNITVKPVVPMAYLIAKNAYGRKERTHYKRLSGKMQYAQD